MTEQEKMLAGKIYDPSDKTLTELRIKGHRLSKLYNDTFDTEEEKRKEILDEIGYFDEEHFAYLEDIDVGYRAQIYGYENWYCPRAVVWHVGSGTSGSRYNEFKVRHSSRNNVYMIYKNMPFLQIVLNLPFFLVGFGAKILFFASKGFGREYLAGIKNGFQISRKNRKVKFSMRNFPRYIQLQVELWINIFRRFAG